MLSSATRLVDAGRVAERLADRLVEPAKILIIIGIAYTLATRGLVSRFRSGAGDVDRRESQRPDAQPANRR